MGNLKKEYIDSKNIPHKVEHYIKYVNDKSSKEQIVDELYRILTRAGKRIPA